MTSHYLNQWWWNYRRIYIYHVYIYTYIYICVTRSQWVKESFVPYVLYLSNEDRSENVNVMITHLSIVYIFLYFTTTAVPLFLSLAAPVPPHLQCCQSPAAVLAPTRSILPVWHQAATVTLAGSEHPWSTRNTGDRATVKPAIARPCSLLRVTHWHPRHRDTMAEILYRQDWHRTDSRDTGTQWQRHCTGRIHTELTTGTQW